MNENKTGVITQIIPRYTSEYYRNLDYSIPQVRTNRGKGLEMLLGLNRVILSSELGGEMAILDVLTSNLKTCKSL